MFISTYTPRGQMGVAGNDDDDLPISKILACFSLFLVELLLVLWLKCQRVDCKGGVVESRE